MYQKIIELAEKKGVTLADVSRGTGIGQNVLSNLKYRQGNLSFENTVKVADYFDVPLDFFANKEVKP